MVETDDRDPLETQELRRLIAPVTSDNLTALVGMGALKPNASMLRAIARTWIRYACADCEDQRAGLAGLRPPPGLPIKSHQDYQLNQYSQLSALYSRRTK
jgi:hypothetical protein